MLCAVLKTLSSLHLHSLKASSGGTRANATFLHPLDMLLNIMLRVEWLGTWALEPVSLALPPHGCVAWARVAQTTVEWATTACLAGGYEA